MNHLQSLGLSKPQAHVKQSSQQNPPGLRNNSAVTPQAPVPRSSEIAVQNVDMIQAWVNGGSVEMPKSRVAPKNVGKKIDFFG